MSAAAADAAAGATPALPDGVRTVREVRSPGKIPLYRQPEWERAYPWLIQATTGRGEDSSDGFDLGLFGDAPVGPVLERWGLVREALGTQRAVHSRQVHGRNISGHEDASPGLLVLDGYDAHWTARAGILLTVSVADCVPIFLVDPGRRRVALLHGGWRGTAAGILARGIEALGGDPADLKLHLGPAICGRCYEVGPEVHAALGLPRPDGKRPVDVRAVQAIQAIQAGIPASSITLSEHCTLCGGGFFSHRAGSSSRQMGVLALCD